MSSLPLKKKVKKLAKEQGADLVGIAGIGRYDEAPPNMHPTNVLPNARSLVVIANRISRGALVALGKGNHASYNCYGYGGLCEIMRKTMYSIMCFLEDQGYTAVPIDPLHSLLTDAPARNISLRVAAFLAGLGEYGYSKVFLTPEFGPRQRFGVIITDAPMESDPLFSGKICDQCKVCITQCPANALDPDRGIVTKLAGKKVKHVYINEARCAVQHHGLKAETSPFVSDPFPFDDRYDDFATIMDRIPPFLEDNKLYFYQRFHYEFGTYSICGARGCIRACAKHLEEIGRIPAFSTPIPLPKEEMKARTRTAGWWAFESDSE